MLFPDLGGWRHQPAAWLLIQRLRLFNMGVLRAFLCTSTSPSRSTRPLYAARRRPLTPLLHLIVSLVLSHTLYPLVLPVAKQTDFFFALIFVMSGEHPPVMSMMDLVLCVLAGALERHALVRRLQRLLRLLLCELKCVNLHVMYVSVLHALDLNVSQSEGRVVPLEALLPLSMAVQYTLYMPRTATPIWAAVERLRHRLPSLRSGGCGEAAVASAVCPPSTAPTLYCDDATDW